jgi:hypothetical protein
MSLTQIQIVDPTCYLTTGTQVDKDGNITNIGNEGEGYITGTDWYTRMDYNTGALTYDMTAFREQKIDIQGLEMKPIAALGLDFVQSEVSSSFYKTYGYMREYTIITTKRLDRDELMARIALFSAPLPFDEYRVGGVGGTGNREPLITRDQCLAGRSTLYGSDSSLPGLYGFLRTMSNYDLNMGTEVGCDALYYYRVMYATGDLQSAAQIFWDNSARTTILTVNVRDDADDTQIATGMIRAYQAPQGA